MPDNFGQWIIPGILLAVYGLYLFRVLRRYFAPQRKVKAQVVDKNRIETFSKYSGNGKQYRYVITFEAEGKRLSFHVSEFSYGGYRKGERGTLTYKGDRLIDFH